MKESTETGSSSKLKLVSFDTSASSVHLALFEGEQIVASEIHETNLAASGTARQEAANLLIPSLDRMTSELKWQKADIDAIAVGSGPGSFTGIRTSIVTARALAQALSVPLLPVSLLQCYFSQFSGEAIVVLYATVGFYFVAHSVDSSFNCESAHFYFNESDLKEFLQSHSDCSHYGNAEAVGALEKASVNLILLPPFENIAVAQGRIALEQLKNKMSDATKISSMRSYLFEQFNYESVVPTYLRNPSVTIKKVSA